MVSKKFLCVIVFALCQSVASWADEPPVLPNIFGLNVLSASIVRKVDEANRSYYELYANVRFEDPCNEPDLKYANRTVVQIGKAKYSLFGAHSKNPDCWRGTGFITKDILVDRILDHAPPQLEVNGKTAVYRR